MIGNPEGAACTTLYKALPLPFSGFLPVACADVSVVPSLYEPFGIVAIEAMAARSPVVVSDTGGLSEIVEHDRTGVKVYMNDPDSLAWGIAKVLLNEGHASRIKDNAYKTVQEKFNWDKIAQQTKHVYESVLDSYAESFWAKP